MKRATLGTLLFVLLISVSFASGQSKDNTQPTIHIRDYCDPASFNAAVGPDTCVRDTTNGLITFEGFVAELGSDKSVGAWRFAPAQIRVPEGAAVQLQNLGGETHTFTEVKKFGGGFVDFLNAASGNPVPAPECAQVVDDKLVPQPPSDENIFIPAGSTATLTFDDEKAAKYQCCIHPWMRTIISPKDQHHEQVH
jgi:plastocyanin